MSGRRPSSATAADALGLVESTSYVRLAALFTHALLAVAFLVFINASSPFVLASLDHRLPEDATGSATSRFLLADELTALSLYLPVGALADSAVWGLRRCTLAGYLVVAAALAAYVRASSLEWLVASRVLFAVRPGSCRYFPLFWSLRILSLIRRTFTDRRLNAHHNHERPSLTDVCHPGRGRLRNDLAASRSVRI